MPENNVDPATGMMQAFDVTNAFEWLNKLQLAVNVLQYLVEVVAAIRADVAEIGVRVGRYLGDAE